MQLSQSILLAIFLASASSAIAAPAGPSDTTALAERSVDTEEIVELAARSPSPRRGGGRSGSRGRGAFRAAGKALKWAANNAGGNEERSLEEDEVMELAARSPSPEPRRGGGRSGSRGRGAFRAAGKAFRFAAQQAGGGNEERSLEEDEVMELAARSPSPEPRGRGGFGGRGGGRGRSGSRGRGGFRKFRQAAQQQQSNEERSLEEDDVMELVARDFDDEEVMELAARSPSPEPRRGGGGRSGSRSGSRGRGAFRAAGKAFRFAAQQASGGGNEERSLEEDEVMELAARDFDDEEVMDLAARSPSPRGRGGFGGRGGGRGRSGSRRGGFRKFRQAAQQQQSNEERSLEEDEVMELAARDFDDEEVMDLAARSPSPEPEPRGRGGFGGRGGGRGRSGSRRGGFRKFRQAAQQQQSNEERSIDELD